MAVGDVLRLTYILRSDTSPDEVVNQLYFRQATALVFDTPEEDLADSFLNNALPELSALHTNVLKGRVIRIAPGPPFLTTYELDVDPTPGTRTGDALPPRTSAVINFQTADFSRRGRGRIYLPPASEADSSGGNVTFAYISLMDAFTAALTSMGTSLITWAQWEHGIFSRADQLFKPVIAYKNRIPWASQRDRGGTY